VVPGVKIGCNSFENVVGAFLSARNALE
jgi:hypothetical protein